MARLIIRGKKSPPIPPRPALTHADPPFGWVPRWVPRAGAPKGGDSRGFTLIELMVVLTIIAILATIAIPTYMDSVIKAKEATLLEDLYIMRDSIDKFYADNGKYPSSLASLVEKRYIRKIPVDPFTLSDKAWQEVPSEDSTGVYDVHSGSNLIGRNGLSYGEW